MLAKGVIAISFVMIFWQLRDTLVEGDRKCKYNFRPRERWLLSGRGRGRGTIALLQ